MNVRSKLVAVVGSALLLASSVGGALAQTTTGDVPEAFTDATVSIERDDSKNYLAVSITGGGFDAVDYSLTNQPTDGTLTVTATNTRGNGLPWKVSLSAGNFRNTAETESFDITNLVLTPATPAPVEFQNYTGSTTGMTTPSIPQVSATAAEFWTAPKTAVGQYTLVLNGVLNIPGGTLIGDYTSRVTVSIDAAP